VKQSRAPQTCSTRPVPCDHNTKRCCGRCAPRELLLKDAHAHGSAVGLGHSHCTLGLSSASRECMQEERDNDQEFALKIEEQQRSLMQERDIAQTLKGETAILRKKFEAFQTEMEDMRTTLREREREIRQLQASQQHAIIPCESPGPVRKRAPWHSGVPMRLCGARCVAQGEAVERDKAMDLLRKDVREREESVSDKERRMAELKAKNKELEKFKFVLDYKLRELKKEIEPRDEQIMQMRETIRELDEELQHDHRRRGSKAPRHSLTRC